MYVDTSALGRVLLGEPDAPAVLRDLAGFDQHVASRLVRIELRRLATLREDAPARRRGRAPRPPGPGAGLTVGSERSVERECSGRGTDRGRLYSPAAVSQRLDPSRVRPGRVNGPYFRENFAQGGIDLVQIVPELVANCARPMRTGRRPVLSWRRPPRDGP